MTSYNKNLEKYGYVKGKFWPNPVFFKTEEELNLYYESKKLGPAHNPYPGSWPYPKPGDEHITGIDGHLLIQDKSTDPKKIMKKTVQEVKVPDWDKNGVIIKYDDNTVRYFSLLYYHGSRPTATTQSAGRKARRSRRNRKKSKRTRRC